MKISHHLCLVRVALFMVFAAQSDAIGLTKALNKTVQTEKFLASKSFQDMQEALIMNGSDKSSILVRTAIQAIRLAALKCKADGVLPIAVDTALGGILSAVRLITRGVSKANDAVDKASNLFAHDPEAAMDAIKTGFKSDTEFVLVASVPIHDAQGALLVQIGGAAQPALKKTIISVQNAGNGALECLDMAEQLAVMGMKTGGRAAEVGFNAARETILTGGLSVLVNLIEAAKHTFDALRKSALKELNQGDLVSGIIDSLKTTVSTESQEALAAIARINMGVESVLSVLTKKSAIDAANVMAQGIITTILETADAISVAKKSLEEAAKLSDEDIGAAIGVVRKEIQAAEDEVISGSAGAYLGLGAAGQISDLVEKLVPSVIEIEYGRVTAFEQLRIAEQVATIGLRSGGLAAVQGLVAGSQICEAAGNAMYTQLADAGEIGFDALRSI